MYKPKYNQVLVEIDTTNEKWGKETDNLGGVVYSEGKVIIIGKTLPTSEYPVPPSNLELQEEFSGQDIMWNEGHEAGKVFEYDQRKYALIYWWDIAGGK
jgi:hypothetical protein